MPITIKPTQLKYKDPSTSQYVSVVAAAAGGSSNVDVQINGTSILSNGVANIPLATSSLLGVVKVNDKNGIGLTEGQLYLLRADASAAKDGSANYRAIVPSNQHLSVFYGLAKVAGADMSSSSNAVGVYTDAAKTAIQSMLAVPSSNNPVFTGAFSQNRKSNTTIGTNSFSSGDNCEASAEDSHAEGRYTVASGHYSHAEGNYTTASGMASHAAGTVTIANHASQYTFGEYNVEDSSSASALSRGNYVEIVGNGTASNAQSNARALDWSGNEYLNGYIYVGCNNNSANGTRIPHDIQIDGTSIVSNGVANIPIGNTTTPGVFIRGFGLYQDGAKLGVNGSTSENIKGGTAGTFTPVSKQHEATFYGLAKAAGDSTQSASSNAVGVYTNNAKTAIQNMLSVSSSNDPVFTGSFSQNRKANTTVGPVSAVIGYDNAAEGSGAIAMGYDNRAYSQGSIALGNNNTIYGDSAVAIGYKNIAQYQSSFVFGSYNAIDTITDWASNVEYDVGDLVYNNAYVLECLTAHTSESTLDYSKWRMVLKYLFVIGNGNGENARSNALAVSIEGDLRLKNNLYVNCNADSSGGIRVPHDIQINGTSIVSNGIASIPIADETTLGVIKVAQSSYGLRTQDGELRIVPATDTQIKSATSNTRPITPIWQHYSVFYGLAAAAGDITQASSSNTVGTYTNAAKTAIQNMLGVLSINDPIFTGSLSCGRTANSYSGPGSIAIGTNIVASGYGSIGFGYESEATGSSSIAGGHKSEAIGAGSIAIGTYNTAIYDSEVVLGRYNFIPTYDDWVDGTEYEPGDIVKYNNNIYKCYETTDSAIPGYSGNWRSYIRNLLTVGSGGYIDDRSNALTLTVDGDLYLHKDLYINADISGNNGSKVATEAYVSTSIGNIILPTKVSDLTNDSGFLTSVPTMTGATASTNGTSGLVPAPTSGDIYKFLAGDGTYRSGGLPMVILSYGNSTWSDFIEAYNNHVIVYCRASSNANPKTGSQTRMAFMAYVNNADSPTNVEFQYYRSMSSHSGTQMGDQVYVYKLDKNSGWSVTVREAGLKEIEFDASTGLKATWSNNKLTITTI